MAGYVMEDEEEYEYIYYNTSDYAEESNNISSYISGGYEKVELHERENGIFNEYLLYVSLQSVSKLIDFRSLYMLAMSI